MRKFLMAAAAVGSTFALSSALAAGLTLTASGHSVPVSATVSTNYCAAPFNINYDTTTGYVNSVTVTSASTDCNGDMYSIGFSGKPSPSLDSNSDPVSGTLIATSVKGSVANGFKIVFAVPLAVSSLGNVTLTIAP
jgi:hypothetical protein